MDDDKNNKSGLDEFKTFTDEMGPDYMESMAEQEAMINNVSIGGQSYQPYQPNSNAWRKSTISVGNSKQLQKKEEQDSSTKVGEMAARGAADVATGGSYEKIRNAPVVGKVAKAAESSAGIIGKSFNKMSGGMVGKAAKKADDAGALDAMDKTANMIGGNPNQSLGNQFAKKNSVPNAKTNNTQNNDSFKNRNSSLISRAAAMSAASSKNTPKDETAQTTKAPRAGSFLPKNPFQKKDAEVEKQKKEGSINVLEDLRKKLKKGIIAFLLANPLILLFLLSIILLVALIFGVVLVVSTDIIDIDSDSDVVETAHSGSSCDYDVKTSLGNSINLSGIKVELINCDGKKSNYKVLETIDFEKYVLGVALAEAGESSPDEAIKAQIIAARNFALTRSGGTNTGMCPGNYNSCFYGYNSTSGVIRMRACEADQVYWDYTKDIYRRNRGAISLYSPEVNSGTIWKHALSATRQAEVEKLAEAVKGETLVDSNGSLIETNYAASITDKFIERAKAGKTYKEILEAQYGSGKTNDAECNDGSAGTGEYNITNDNNGILHEPLSSFLASKGSSVDEYNNTIKRNVEKAGYGTRAGVVAAATTLVGELGNKYGLRFPYFWGGGHEGVITNYARADWGSTNCYTYANGQSYNYCGLDCSGFVSWALYNGGYNVSSMVTTQFSGLNGARRVSLSSSPVLKPGDILDSQNHVILVLGVDTANGVYNCAEAAGNSKGVLFSTRPFYMDGYWGVNMDGFYNNKANVR